MYCRNVRGITRAIILGGGYVSLHISHLKSNRFFQHTINALDRGSVRRLTNTNFIVHTQRCTPDIVFLRRFNFEKSILSWQLRSERSCPVPNAALCITKHVVNTKTRAFIDQYRKFISSDELIRHICFEHFRKNFLTWG